jgi:hypothetical protein
LTRSGVRASAEGAGSRPWAGHLADDHGLLGTFFGCVGLIT